MSQTARVVTGAGGALLLISLFLPWASEDSYEANGWELFSPLDIFLLIAALAGILAALTGGRFGVFRPDVSLHGAADLLAVVGTILIAWFLIADFPDGVGKEIGVYLGLIGAIVQAAGAGDYEAVRRGEMFAPVEDRPRRDV